MTAEYDNVASLCDRLCKEISVLFRHQMPDWLHHRLSVLKAEAEGTCREMREHAGGEMPSGLPDGGKGNACERRPETK